MQQRNQISEKFHCYFLIPSSNENNLIYLRSSEWGKHDKQARFFIFTSSNIRNKKQSINTKNMTVLWHDARHSYSELKWDTHRSYSELLPSCPELKQDTHHSYSEVLPSYSELKHETYCSCSELLPSYSDLTQDTHRSYTEPLPSCSELKRDTHRSYSELFISYSELKYNTHRSYSKRLPWAASYSTRNCFSELVSFSSELKTPDWLIWDIKHKLGTHSISSTSQKFSWIS